MPGEEGAATSLGDLERAHDAAIAEQAPEEAPAEAKEEKETKQPDKEVEEKKTPKEEPDDNRERSNLGRKVKYLEEKLSKLDEIAAKIDRFTSRKEPEPDDDAPIPMTARELREFVRREASDLETSKAEKQKEYERGYLKHEASLGMDLSEEEYAEVINERLQNFNVRHTDNPNTDAELNFHKAYAAVLKKKMSKGKENPLKGKKPDGPLGGTTTSESTTRAAATPKLDKEAAEFAAKMGLSAEMIAKALGSKE